MMQALVRIKRQVGHVGVCAQFILSARLAGFIALLMDQIHAVAKYELDVGAWHD